MQYACHAAFDSPEAFDRVWREDCKPEPMTLARAVEVLNQRKYRGVSWWGISAGTYKSSYAFWVDQDETTPKPQNTLSEFEAIAIAEKLEREAK